MEPIKLSGDEDIYEMVSKLELDLISAISSLNMESTPISEEELEIDKDDLRFLSRTDKWCKHCVKHLENSLNIASMIRDNLKTNYKRVF